MTSSWFPERWPGTGARAVTGHQLNEEDSFRPARTQAGTVQAALGLQATAARLERFALGWSSLPPAALARQALRPQAWPRRDTTAASGPGWRISQSPGAAGQARITRGVSVSLVLRLDSGHVHMAMTNRGFPI
jgi:hypothetical protein